MLTQELDVRACVRACVCVCLCVCISNVDGTVTSTFVETTESAGEVNFSGCEGKMGTDVANVAGTGEENSHEAVTGTGEEVIWSASESNFPELKGAYGVRSAKADVAAEAVV